MSKRAPHERGAGSSRTDSSATSALVARMVEGDQNTLAVLYDQTSHLVFGLALRVLRNRSAAEEVLLDVYKQAWRQCALYDERRGTPTGWLLKIAHSRAIDRVRVLRRDQALQRAVEERMDRESLDEDPESRVAIAERQAAVRRALDALPAEQRAVIVLAYFSGLSQSEIASQLELPLGTVKTRARLGLAKLRELLSGIEPE